MVSVPQQPEVAVAQRLASNERPVRTRALKTLKKYINLRSQTGGFCRDDLLKIWKGLFYSLWMQDKRDLQEELSDRVSSLIHSFHTFNNQLLYFETFLQTMKREWNGIDRLRMDKFFQLVRFVFRQVFEVLKRSEWESSLVDQFLAVFTAELLQSAGRVPDGLMLHILELYMTELARVGSAELKAEQNLTFIQPFCKTISETKDRSVLSSICKHIFSTILDHASYAVEELMKELSDGGEDSGAAEEEESEEEEETGRRSLKKVKEKVNGVEHDDEDSDYELMDLDNEDLEEDDSDDEVGPVLQFDYGALADCLFELGSRPLTPNFNRNKIYKLVKTFRDLSEGIFPQDDDANAAVKPKGSSKKKKKKGKKSAVQRGDDKSPAKKRKACEEEQTLIEPDQDEEPPSVSIKKKKKKRKNEGSETEQSAETPQDRQETEEKSERLAVVVDSETQSQTQDHKGLQSELEPSVRKKGKGKIRKCLDAEMLEEEDSGSLQTSAPPSVKKKSGKKGKKVQEEGPDCSNETLTDVQQENDISASSPVKKKKKKQKQKSATNDEEVVIISETGPDVEILEIQDPNVPSLSETTAFTKKRREGAVSKKKKIKAKDDVEIITIPEDSCDTDTASATITTSATDATKLQSDTVSPTPKKKKNKKQKVKELEAQISEPAEEAVKEPEVAADDKPTRKGRTHTAEEEEAAVPVQTPTRKKKSQKKNKQQLLELIEDVKEEVQLPDLSEEPALKKSRKQKQKAAAAEATEAAVESTPLRKTKKKRKIQADEAETSQINGKAGTEDLEISTSVKSKKKLKKASSQSDFASFQSQTAVPAPLFCRVKPKGKSRTGASTLKTFLKADTKKVTFGLKNNKTTEFRTTDQSLLVSPVGSSRVAFDPEKKPASGVLKSPSASPFTSLKKATPKKRPTAADFF